MVNINIWGNFINKEGGCMKYAQFAARCPFELHDNVKIIVDKENNILSDDVYKIVDILGIHSVRYGTVTFKIVIEDSKGVELPLMNVNDLKLIK